MSDYVAEFIFSQKFFLIAMTIVLVTAIWAYYDSKHV